ncbi:O-acyltransferase WSD1 [Bienertia sinuspersici]
MIKIPRFSSLLVVDPHDGAEHWEKTDVNIDDHIIIHHDDEHDHHDDDDVINSYLADIAISPPMSMDKPLWEVHIMHEYKCMIVRVHHAVADGMSLMSLLRTMGRSSYADMRHDGEHHHHVSMPNKSDENGNNKGRKGITKRGLLESLMFIWLNIVAGFKYIARCLWEKDKRTMISGIEGVELWPRKVSTARFNISDMKPSRKPSQMP